MVNNVIRVVNYVIAAHPSLLNFMIADKNLTARVAEAEREGWLGEIEGLKVSLAGADDKLAQIDRRRPADTPVSIGMPVFPDAAAPRKEPHDTRPGH
jgi:hypothetical protein